MKGCDFLGFAVIVPERERGGALHVVKVSKYEC